MQQGDIPCRTQLSISAFRSARALSAATLVFCQSDLIFACKLAHSQVSNGRTAFFQLAQPTACYAVTDA